MRTYADNDKRVGPRWVRCADSFDDDLKAVADQLDANHDLAREKVRGSADLLRATSDRGLNKRPKAL